MTNNQQLLILVDENDHQTGTAEKLEAHKKPLLHRAISVLICNSKGEWLLHRRALGKYHSNGLWTNAACSHPYPGESNLNAAARRLKEEMGIQCALNEIFSFVYYAQLDSGLTEHEFDHVFCGITDSIPQPDPAEVMDWKFMAYNDLLADIEQNPENYTVWFKIIIEKMKLMPNMPCR